MLTDEPTILIVYQSVLYMRREYLRDLQGDIIPMLVSVQLNETHAVQVFDWPHHGVWIEAYTDMPDALKRRCIETLDRLHVTGVLHGDIKLSNILIGKGCRVMITDFSKSRASVPVPEIGLQQAQADDFRKEMWRLKCILDYENPRQGEGAKVQRTSSRQRKEIFKSLD